MNNTIIIIQESNKLPLIFKNFDYIKLFADIFFCLVNICKLFLF